MTGPTPTSRELALRLLVEWDSSRNVHLEKILATGLRDCGLDDRDRRFVTQLCGTAVRHRNTLKEVSEILVRGELRHYPRSIRDALALGLVQRIYLSVPDHALVDATLDAWQRTFGNAERPALRRKFVGLLNAVLRRACQEIVPAGTAPELLDDPDTIWGNSEWIRVPGLGLPARHVNLPQMLAIKFSHTPDRIRHWQERYAEPRLLELLRWNNRAPTLCLVLRREVNPDLYRRRLAILDHEVQSTSDPHVLRLVQPGDVERLPGFDQGEFWVQDITARKLALKMPLAEGGSLLDLCAAPGGKLASLLDRESFKSVVACDVNPVRLQRLRTNLERLHFPQRGIEFRNLDPDPERTRFQDDFDRVLLDVPCSNTGVLARRHEARWRLLPEHLRQLHQTQLGLLRLAARTVRPGGFILYTTCSIEPNENAQLVHDFLHTTTDFKLLHEIEYFPGDEQGDGGYAALLRKR